MASININATCVCDQNTCSAQTMLATAAGGAVTVVVVFGLMWLQARRTQVAPATQPPSAPASPPSSPSASASASSTSTPPPPPPRRQRHRHRHHGPPPPPQQVHIIVQVPDVGYPAGFADGVAAVPSCTLM